jgi:glutamate synthase (ferredoxin)
MTGGRVVVLGQTGKNFAAGMSGGIAYVFDEKGKFPLLCNREMVNLTQMKNEEEVRFIRGLVLRHFELTQSQRAGEILQNWERILEKFVRVIPKDYQRVVEEQKPTFVHEFLYDEVATTAIAENVAA